MTAQLGLLGGGRRARFSPCRTWRYVLEDVWDAFAPPLVSVGCNPSDADEYDDDPTIRLERGLAQRMGRGSLIKLNVFALVSTDPKGLLHHHDPVGTDNLAVLEDLTAGRPVLCTWGGMLRWFPWSAVEPMVRTVERGASELLCLGVTKDGDPWHPLYKPRTEPRPWEVVMW